MPGSYAKTDDGISRNNTRIIDKNQDYIVKLHNTYIYWENESAVMLSSGGYASPTTVRRMNQVLYHRGIGGGVSIKRGELYFDGAKFLNGRTHEIVKGVH